MVLSGPQNSAIWVFLSYCTPTVCPGFLGNRVNILTLPGGGVVVVCTNINSPLLQSAGKSHAMDLLG